MKNKGSRRVSLPVLLGLVAQLVLEDEIHRVVSFDLDVVCGAAGAAGLISGAVLSAPALAAGGRPVLASVGIGAGSEGVPFCFKCV